MCVDSPNIEIWADGDKKNHTNRVCVTDRIKIKPFPYKLCVYEKNFTIFFLFGCLLTLYKLVQGVWQSLAQAIFISSAVYLGYCAVYFQKRSESRRWMKMSMATHTQTQRADMRAVYSPISIGHATSSFHNYVLENNKKKNNNREI